MSEHRFTLPGTTAPEVLVRTKAFGFPEVVVDGLAIPRQVRGGRSVWEIPVGGGTRTLVIRGGLSGLQGAVEGELFRIERRLALWELLLAMAPISLAALGVLPGVIGFLAVLAALRLVRLPGRASIRLAILAVNLVVATLLAYLLYLATW